MRAVTFSRFGGPEVLEVGDFPEPPPGPGEVRIRVTAATVNPTDISFRSGRQAAQVKELGLEPPYIPGMELAGVIDAAGGGTDWRIGDRVMAIVNPRRPGGGAQAELVVVPATSVARVPEGTSLEAAATLPMNGLTVRLALDQLALRPGQTLGVTGAAGAVGGYAVELGVADGLRVIAVAGPRDEALVKGFGAEKVVPRGDAAIRGLYDAAPGGVDGLIDAAVLDGAVLPAIRNGGKLATVRGFAGPSERGITIEPVRVVSYLHNQEALDRLGRLVTERRLSLRVAETFPPERAADAQRKLDAGGTRGRLLIVF
ncbi:MAG TPA: NADP-dependent oxidoreductase [Candidatus Methylomirabilis sp.]|nr:NADP-dependent oxidoreductase [Candidatus Methylomirabilis sp.]